MFSLLLLLFIIAIDRINESAIGHVHIIYKRVLPTDFIYLSCILHFHYMEN